MQITQKEFLIILHDAWKNITELSDSERPPLAF